MLCNILPEKVKRRFPKGIPYNVFCPSTKMTVMQAMCSLFWKHKVQSAVFCCLREETILSCQQKCAKKVRPLRVAARRQQELVCVMAS